MGGDGDPISNAAGKGGSPRGQSESQGESNLSAMAWSLMNEAAPLRQAVLGQTLEALNTGGIGARLPIAQKGVEASRAATANALKQTGESLGSAGLRGSSFEQTLRANTLLQGELATAAIPQDIAMQFIGVAPSMTLGLGGQAIQGAGTAGGLYNQRQSMMAQQDAAKGSQQSSMMGTAASVGLMAAMMMCWVARALYGETGDMVRVYAWITTRWPRWAIWLYRRYGYRASRSPVALRFLKPIFDRGL